MSKKYLGIGWGYPITPDSDGEVKYVSQEQKIQQSVLIILGTAKGERLMRPEFGSRLHELVFAPQDASTQGLIKLYVKEALAQWEPRIEVRDVETTSPPGQPEVVLVEIKYQIKDTHDERSIIHPFYITGEEPPI